MNITHIISCIICKSNYIHTSRVPIRNRGFTQATKPNDEYVINLNDIGPRGKTEELFTTVGVSNHV